WFEDLEIMLAGDLGLIELVRVKVCQREVGASLRWVLVQNLQQLVSGIGRIIGALQAEREIVTRISRAGFDGERVFKVQQRFLPDPEIIGGQPLVIIGLEIGRIRLSVLLIGKYGLSRIVVLLGFAV